MGITVLLPGGFKPPHGGHIQLAKNYAKNSKVDKVLMLVGPKEREGISREQSMMALQTVLKDPKIIVVATEFDNPMSAAFEMLFDKSAKGSYALAASSKGKDAERLQMFADAIENYKRKPDSKGRTISPNVNVDTSLRVDIKPLSYKGRTDQFDGAPISATIARQDLRNGDKKNFATNYPGVDRKTTDKLFDIFSKSIVTPEKLPLKKKKIRESALFGRLLEQEAKKKLLAISVLQSVLNEGGAAGHMAHPFDLPSVSTGRDLIKVFEDTAKFLQRNEVPVKIDGINSSIRLANIDGTKQFVLDRGSNKPFDVKGMTTADLEARFGAGHGMIKVGGTVLDIFNEALPSIRGPLTKLGMTRNPNLMLNIEYVEGKSNVQEYEGNFIVIHNLLEIKQVTPTRRGTQEAPYSKEDLQALVDRLKPIAKESGFEVFNVIPAKVENPVDLGSALSENYTVNYSRGKKETKSLAQWLSSAKNTKGEKLRLKDGRTVDALSKQVFMWINSGKPVDQLVENPRDFKLAVDSFAIYLGTIKLGDEILKSMTSPLGSLDQQEGIVVRNRRLNGGKPYKITGSFITRGLQSSFN